ncbi:phosphotransferase [Aquisalimonas sp. APHAB1-3]|uniref:phosphotransferase n=1 Tax=Aquisalimonas sp. APHAB1-3 TaxID=3402080 RepID=UPI003AADAB72
MRLFRSTGPRALPAGARFSDGREVRSLLADVLGGPVADVRVLNHHGLLSLRVDSAGHRYKVSECESETRAALAASALELVAAASGPVPRGVARSRAVLVTEWVEGRACCEEPLAAQVQWLLQCQLALANASVPPDIEAGGYLHLESLASRFRHCGRLVLSGRRIEAVLGRLWEQLPPLAAPHIIHPDLTPANVVLTDNGPVVIDNEAIAVARGREFDIWNTGEALRGRRDLAGIESYVRAFSAYQPLPSLYEYRNVWDAFRLMRQGLKALEKRRLVKAARMLRRL